MRVLTITVLSIAGCGEPVLPAGAPPPGPRAAARPVAGDPASPLPLQSATDLDRLLAETPVVLMGTLDERITQAWGSALPALDLGHRVVALRVPLDRPLPEPGSTVWVLGRLRLPQAGESMLASVTVRDGGTLDDPQIAVGFTVGADEILPSAEARPTPARARAVADDAQLDALLGARPVRAEGTLVAATSPDGAPRFGLLLADHTLVELRVPIEALDQANSLSGRPVTVAGGLSLSLAGRLRFQRPDGLADRPVAVALAAVEFGPALAP